MKYNVKVYVACSLTHAPQEFQDSVEKLKAKLREVCEVLDFMYLMDVPPRAIYKHCINNCVYQCDLLLAICDLPSIGLGMEMATQMEARKKPVLAVAHKDVKVTNMALDPGLADYEFRRYENLQEDVFDMAVEKIKQMLAE